MYSKLLDELSQAIGARLLVKFEYGGEIFVVEPHLVGRNHNQQDCLCAWQSNCQEATDEQEPWRCFELSHISGLTLLDDRFCRKRPGYDPYNNSMMRIYYRI